MRHFVKACGRVWLLQYWLLGRWHSYQKWRSLVAITAWKMKWLSHTGMMGAIPLWPGMAQSCPDNLKAFIWDLCIGCHTSSHLGHLKLVTLTMRDGNKDVWYGMVPSYVTWVLSTPFTTPDSPTATFKSNLRQCIPLTQLRLPSNR